MVVLQLLDTMNMAPSCRVLPALSLPPKNALFISNCLLRDENPQSPSPVLISIILKWKIVAGKLVLLLYSCIYHIFWTKIGTYGWIKGWSIWELNYYPDSGRNSHHASFRKFQSDLRCSVSLPWHCQNLFFQ